MPKLGPINWKRFEKFLLSVGCVCVRQEASHRIYRKERVLRSIVIQAKGDVPIFIILNNLRTLGITREEYLRTLAHL